MTRFLTCLLLLLCGASPASLPRYSTPVPAGSVTVDNAVRVTYTRGLDLNGGFGGAGGIGGLLARTEGNSSLFYHADGAGNVTALMDSRGRVQRRYLYELFGRLIGKLKWVNP